MSTTPTSDVTTAKPAWKLSPTNSLPFNVLEGILKARYIGWVEFTIKAKAEYSPRSYAPTDIGEAIGGLEESELARALVRACIHGDVEIAKAIWEQRGPFAIEYQEGSSNQWLINGEVVHETTTAKHILTNARSIAEVSELMEWMPTVGLGFLSGVGTETGLMLQSYKLEEPIQNLSWSSNFIGELPILSAGAIAHPELMMVLEDKVRSSHYPEAYQDILCWVEEGMAAEFSEALDPFESIQSLFLKSAGSGDQIREIHVSDVTAEALSDVSRKTIVDGFVSDSFEPWRYQSLDLRTFPVDPTEPRNNMVLGYQADEPLKHGFNHKPGFVLCRTRVDFLRQFEIGQVQQDNLSKAKDFAANYFPLDLVMLQTAQTHIVRSGCVRTDNGMHHSDRYMYSITKLYKALGNDSPIQSYLQKALQQPLMDFVRDTYCVVSLDAESMLALFQGLGIDNTKFGLDLNHKGLKLLHDAGFRFSDDSKTVPLTNESSTGRVINHRLSSQDTDVMLNINSPLDLADSLNLTPGDKEAVEHRFANAIAMNLWPSTDAKPASLYDAVVRAGRKKKWKETAEDQSLLAFIDHAGIEACAAVAKTTPHWNFLKTHFGREAIEPYIGETTREARGNILMDDLGL